MKSLKNESIVSQLYKQPQKEIPATHKMIYKPNYEHEIDILYVPRDGEYLYILSVVDCHNSLCDARPLKSRKGEEIVNNLNDIYNKSKYLKKPQHIHVDNEFNKTYFSKYCEENDIKLHTAAPYRSRQQAHVERLNQEIGRLIFRMELDEEIDTGKTSTRWVQELPEIIQHINNRFLKKLDNNYNDKDKQRDIELNDYKIEAYIPLGSIVRYKLDKPLEYATEEHLSGPFRKVDIKWSKDLYKVIEHYYYPYNPVLFKIQKIKNPEVVLKRLQEQALSPASGAKHMKNKKLEFGEVFNALFNSNCLQVIDDGKDFE